MMSERLMGVGLLLTTAACSLGLEADSDDVGQVEEAVYTGTHWPNGYVDVVGRADVEGWACIDDYHEPMWVHFYDGTTYLGSTFADHDRPGLEQICGGQIRRAFFWAMPRLADGSHTLNVYITTTPTPSRTTYAVLPGAKTVSFPYPLSGSSPFGYVESMTAGGISGWACDTSAPGQPLTLQVYANLDGADPLTLVATGTTSTYRGDVVGICGSGSNAGFSIPLPALRGGLHNLVVIGVNQGAGTNNALNELSAVPNLYDFGCVPPDGNGNGDASDDLQAILDSGKDLILCPGSTYLLTTSACMSGDQPAGLCYRTAGQLIASKTLPAGDGPDASAPILKINGNFTVAVTGFGLNNLRLRNVVLDGNRNTLGYKKSAALATFGAGGDGARIDHSKFRDTRSWSSLHVTESCGGVEVSYNKIEDAGCSKWSKGCKAGDPPYTWADGISFACWTSPSKIFGNVVENATDGGIVLFAPTGTEVFRNTVAAIDREQLGGINMVDDLNPKFISPFYYSNFINVWVHDNVIDARGQSIDVGIAQGKHTWACPELTSALRLYGATVERNTFKGPYLRFGAALDWVDGWRFINNSFIGTHWGTSKTSGCPNGGTVPAPRKCALAHSVNATHSGTGWIQSDCTWVGTGETLHIVLFNN